jgi:tricorn protease
MATSLWGQTKLLRFPDIHDNVVAFSHAGDIWTASAKGGTATRLTAHPGQELFPRFSPDGQWIAFTGQYDGDEQVYVVPTSGGIPKQLTYYPASGPLPPRWGFDNQVYGWTPGGTRVLFRSVRDYDGIRTLSGLYTVSVDGGLPEMLPMPTSGAGDFAPDANRVVYSPLFRDFRTWKRYEGGWAQNLYIFDLATHEAKEIAPSKRTERDPMWIGEKIYFASDRDGTLNLYSYNPVNDNVRQLTKNDTWDVRWPSSDNKSRIVYELNGELEILDTKNNRSQKVSITVPNDGLAMRPSRYSAAKNVEDFALSPKGERALFVARGDIFTVPTEKGPTRNLTRTSGAHDKHARWSPDGRRVAFVSDMTGEDQIHLVNQDGSGEPEQLTTQFAAMLYPPEWSPNGDHLAFSDKDGKLHVLTVEDRSLVEVADDEFGGIFDYTWSPDSNWLAFSLNELSGFSSLHIWSRASGTVQKATGAYFNEYAPSWSPNGDYLYYLSDREFSPQISTVEWNYAGSKSTRVYALALRPDVKNLFPPESDEVEVAQEDEETPDSEENEASSEEKKTEVEKEAKDISIDFEGIADRTIRVPVQPANIGALVAVKGHLLYAEFPAPFYGRSSSDKPKLHIFALDKRKSSVLAEGGTGFAVSHDGSKILVRQGPAYNLYSVKPGSKDKKTVSTKGLMVDRVPAQEWAQIFDEVWRRYRDFFYVRNLHGYNWKEIGDRYRQLLPHVAHRSDLNYVLGEMVSELNVGHAYIEGGDFEIPSRPSVALPGARFDLDEAAGRFRLSKILSGHNEEPKYRAPLTEVGVDVQEGEYVLEIDGAELLAGDNPYELLQHKTDPVTLTVNSEPTLEGSRKVQYKPINSEASLLYLDQVNHNRAQVEKMTDGKVGYIHIPNMGGPGIYEFIKWYYPQIRKEGMVVDVRNNGGGNVSQWIIERLDSKMLGTRFGYASKYPGTYPATVFHGHLVCLINETSASDGDIFPYYFRESGLGPIIGKRSWGGVVGISSRGPLIDGGTVYVPLNGTNAPDGNWIIEGKGVTPDIEVDNEPASVIDGKDPQLERGVREVLKKMEQQPMSLPKRPADPVKTK